MLGAAVDIKQTSDELDVLLSGAAQSGGNNLPLIQETVAELDRQIKRHYIYIDGQIKYEMSLFTGQSTALQTRVAQ